jgi:uncharacterized delta-60 repeat protein
MRKLSLALLFVAAFLAGKGQAGSPDPSFGNQGLVRTDFGSAVSVAQHLCYQVLLHPSGSLYVVFDLNGQTFVARYLSDGTLDAGYGTGGYSAPVPIRDARAVMQPDGKIVAGGYTSLNDNYDFALARFNTDGSPDNTFAGDGKQTTDFLLNQDYITALALQNDGKIVAVGISVSGTARSFALARYNTDGSPDIGFSGDGQLITGLTGTAAAVAVQQDGRMVVAGAFGSHFGVARFLADGTPDNTFNFGGSQTITLGLFSVAKALAIQPDGKILLAGSSGYNATHEDFTLVRLTTNGTLDNTFSGDGIQTTNFAGVSEDVAESIALQSDGKILLAGSVSGSNPADFAVARYNTDGSPDNTFSGDGMLTTHLTDGVNFAQSVAVQPDGRIVVGGWSAAIVGTAGTYDAVRYLANGEPDNSFDADGILTAFRPGGITYYEASALQPDGKMVAAGNAMNVDHTDMAIARYHTNGTPDMSFSGDGRLTITFGAGNSSVQDIVLQPNGKIVAAGYFFNGSNHDFALVRLNPDGSPDNTFSDDGMLLTDFNGEDDFINAVAIQPDGRIVVAGSTMLAGRRDFALARYNTDGTPDMSFSGHGKLSAGFDYYSNVAWALLIQPDGKLVVAGTVNYGNSDFAVLRYNPDGTPDLAFDGDGMAITDIGGNSDEAMTALLQPDGKIVVAGNTITGGGYDFALVRYNSNGSLDNSFAGNGKLTPDLGSTYETINAVALQPGGKIIAGGLFNGVSNQDFVLARFNANGTPDSGFSADGIVISDAGYGPDAINSLAIFNNRLYGVGYTQYGNSQGAITAWLLNDPVTHPLTVTIPDAWTLPAGVQGNTVYTGYGPASDLTLTAQPSGGTAPYTYLWNNGTDSASITVSPLVSTTYSVTVTDASGSQKTAYKTVKVVDVRCGNKADKVMVCQGAQWNVFRCHSVCISAHAVAAQLQNGAYLGSCRDDDDRLIVSVFPNPSTTSFILFIRSNSRAPAGLVVWNAYGRVVERRQVMPNSTVQIGAGYKPGIYLAEVRQGNKKVTVKLFKLAH